MPEAAVLASLRCGNPSALAELKPGETVLDLGSGGGIDGTPVSYSFTFKYDGKEYPVTGAQFDTVSLKRIDANTTSF